MYTPPTAPRTIGGVLDDSFRLFRSSFMGCLPIAFLLALAYWIYAVSFVQVLAAGQSPAQVMAMYRSAHFWEAECVLLLAGLLFQSGLIAVTYATSTGGKLGFAQAMKAALVAFPTGILGMILMFVIAGLGTAALILPGIYLVVRLQFWMIPLVVDRASPFAALGISWDLMKGKWWRTLTIEIVLGIVLLLLAWAVVFVLGLLAAVAAASLHLQPSVRLAVTQALTSLIYLVMMPLWSATMVAIYQDLKLRNSGADLAARVSNLTPA